MPRREWTIEQLVTLVEGSTLVGRDRRARPVRLPAALTDVAEHDTRRWDTQLAQDHPSDFGAAVDSWWQAVARPGEPQSVRLRREQDGVWREIEVTSLNLLHQESIGCVLTFSRQLGEVDTPAPPSRHDGAMFEAPHSIVQHLDEIGTILRTEGDVEEVFGLAASALDGHPVLDHLHPEDRDAAVAMWVEILASPDRARTIQQRIVRPDGSSLWIQSTVMNRIETSGTILSMSHDISAGRAKEAALAASEQELRFLTEVVPVAVFRSTASGNIAFANARWGTLLDDASTLSEVFARVDVDDCDRLRRAFADAKETGGTATCRVRTRDAERHLEFRLQGVVDHADVEGEVDVIGTVDDVTSAVIRAFELQASAERDPLTGLANRRALSRTLDAAVAGARPTLVLFGDLDDFKQVNDRWGHEAGDLVLSAIGHRLRDAVRPDDVVGRWGGDEFVVVCLDVAVGREPDVIERLHLALADPIEIGDDTYMAQVSMGAVRPAPGEDAEAVLRRADTAMYEAKRTRHRTVGAGA
ncbi:diguanylate cyclase domain-containing protein [Actinospongicola halichondriae]|uniref:diguanylate cyclase domain-containing protein n=1 Tax=Actinospongicola halichondriae TaxID=3236844 RepID=UPI003D56BD1D